MTFHVMAFYRSTDEPIEGDLPFDVRPSPDPVVALSEQGHPIFTRSMQLIAGYAVGDALDYVQVETPSLREAVKPYIVPIDAAGWEDEHVTPNVMILSPRPWPVAAQEEIQVKAWYESASGSVGPSPTVALLFFEERNEPAPRGDNYWLRYNAVPGYAGAGSPGWFPLEVTFEERLAIGEYAVVGFEHHGDGVVAARLIFDDQVHRPGAVAVPLSTSGRTTGVRTHPAFYDGTLGVFGTFKSYAMPRIEVHYSESPAYSETHQEGYLRVVRLR